MNVESKYIIRWGLPGWVYLSVITIYLLIEDIPLIEISQEQSTTLLGATLLLAALGLPVGYLIHQISLFFGFVIRGGWSKYFADEIELDNKIISQENGGKIRERYRHLLARVHELRGLKYALLLGILTIAINMFLSNISIKQIIILIVVSLICLFVHINQLYFQKNLKFFKNRVINKVDYIDEIM